eukprot:CAMPEP_0170459860 /NCGR_PEP_ID=MMETSP0123-20130129/6405_1 /TAXON_ID=182087 /ORGANISM="Favella ehrenbergii, Strain Fehren 1" /LENGTH=119 /DNA_ID=CAMNT_0010724581 /DNA_START=363 /DNA_END=722 /DNA_ORIENTATION=+
MRKPASLPTANVSWPTPGYARKKAQMRTTRVWSITTRFVADACFVTLTAKPLNKALASKKHRQNKIMIGLFQACFEAKKMSSICPLTHCKSSNGQVRSWAGSKIIKVMQMPKMPSQPMR